MSEIQDRLENWARWVRPHTIKHRCRSLEGRYKAPPIWHPPEPVIQVDILDAVVVEKALVNPTFPKKYKELIKYAYINPHIHHMKVCRKLSIRVGDIESELRMAILMLENRLRVNENCVKKVLTAIKQDSINQDNNLTLSLT